MLHLSQASILCTRHYVIWILLGLLLWLPHPAFSSEEDEALEARLEFDDQLLEEELTYPSWFKLSFLNLQDDLKEAIATEKKGIIVYFGQKRCAYCRLLIEKNFGQKDIVTYTRRNFDFIPINIWGIESVTDLQGKTLSEQEYSKREDTQFTPSLLFFDAQGKLALKLRGYHPPYTFRAALEFVADSHYKRETFRRYLARADPTIAAEPEDLIEEDFFSPPPFNLDRSRLPGERPLLVFFEQNHCHACDVLHSGPLQEPRIFHKIEHMDSIQLHMWSNTPVITPGGKRLTARAWADELALFHAPSLVFFDKRGKKIIQLNSVVQFFRLNNVLDFVQSGAYKKQPSYPQWRLEQREIKGEDAVVSPATSKK